MDGLGPQELEGGELTYIYGQRHCCPELGSLYCPFRSWVLLDQTFQQQEFHFSKRHLISFLEVTFRPASVWLLALMVL